MSGKQELLPQTTTGIDGLEVPIISKPYLDAGLVDKVRLALTSALAEQRGEIENANRTVKRAS